MSYKGLSTFSPADREINLPPNFSLSLERAMNPLDLTLLEHSLPQSSHTAMAEWSSRT